MEKSEPMRIQNIYDKAELIISINTLSNVKQRTNSLKGGFCFGYGQKILYCNDFFLSKRYLDI